MDDEAGIKRTRERRGEKEEVEGRIAADEKTKPETRASGYLKIQDKLHYHHRHDVLS